MKKVLLLMISLFITCSHLVNSQEMSVNLNYGYAVPTGKLADGAKSGFGGGGISFNYMITENIGAKAGFSYIKFGKKQIDISYLPLTAGVDYYFHIEKISPYVGLSIGHYIADSDVDQVAEDLTKLGIAPNVGFKMPLGQSNFKLNAAGVYNIVFTKDEYKKTKYIQYRLGFDYVFKK